MMKWDRLPGSFFFTNHFFSGAIWTPPLGCLPTHGFFHPICFFWVHQNHCVNFLRRLLSPQDLHSTGGMFGQTHQGPWMVWKVFSAETKAGKGGWWGLQLLDVFIAKSVFGCWWIFWVKLDFFSQSLNEESCIYSEFCWFGWVDAR